MSRQSPIGRLVCVLCACLVAAVCTAGCGPPRPGYVETPVRNAVIDPTGGRVALTTAIGATDSNLIVILDTQSWRLTATLAGLYPSWGASGDPLYYTNSAPQYGRYIRRLDLDKSSVETLSWLPENAIAAICSPTAPEMAVLRGGQPQAIVWVCTSADERCRELFSSGSIVQPSISWSPAGDYLYLLQREDPRAFPAADLMAIQVTTGETRHLDRGELMLPVEAIGDQWLFYVRVTDWERDVRELVRMDLATARTSTVAVPEAAGSLRDYAVAPGGQHVLVRNDQGGLWLIEVNSGSARQVAQHGWAPLWLPKSEGSFIFCQASEEDGHQQLVVLRGRVDDQHAEEVARIAPSPSAVIGPS